VTGIAPYVSMVRTLARELKEGRIAEPQRLIVLQGAARSDEFAYDQELAEAARTFPWLTYVPTISRPWEDPQWPGERGRVDDLVRKYSDSFGLDPAETTAYLCGNPRDDPECPRHPASPRLRARRHQGGNLLGAR